MNEVIIISRAGIQDSETLLQLARQTFLDTFAPYNTESNISRYVTDNFNTIKINEEISNPSSFFYIAWHNKRAIGYLKLNAGKAQTELKDDNSLEIERIYVLGDYQGKKVGQLLFEKAIEVARQQEKSAIWLGVWEENTKAIKFYEKNGFAAFDKHVFKMGDDKQTDIMMKKLLA